MIWSKAAWCKLKSKVDELCEAVGSEDPPNPVPEGWVCEECCAVVGFVTVDVRGNVVQSCGDPVVTRLGVGLYNITAPAGAITSNAWAIIGEPDNNNINDIRAHFSSSFTTGDFHIEQMRGDNSQFGEIDKPFTIQWFGRKKQVVCETVADGEGGGEGGGEGENGEGVPTLPESTGKFVSDNFQDNGNFTPYNLQVRGNASNQTVNWQALVENASYASITDLQPGNYTYSGGTNNGDGTYNHLFIGTEPLTDFAGITIQGGDPVDANGARVDGGGGALRLFCEDA